MGRGLQGKTVLVIERRARRAVVVPIRGVNPATCDLGGFPRFGIWRLPRMLPEEPVTTCDVERGYTAKVQRKV